MAVYVAERGDTEVHQLRRVPFAPSDGCNRPGQRAFMLRAPVAALLHPNEVSRGVAAALCKLMWGWDIRGAWRALWQPEYVDVDLWQVQQAALDGAGYGAPVGA